MGHSDNVWLRIVNEWRENNGLENSIDDVDLVDVQVVEETSGAIAIEITVEEPVNDDLIAFLKGFVPHKSIGFAGVEDKEFQTVTYTPYFSYNPHGSCIQIACDILNQSYRDSNVNPKWSEWFKDFIIKCYNPFMYHLGLRIQTWLQKLYRTEDRKFCEWRLNYMWDEDDETKLNQAILELVCSDYYSEEEVLSKFRDGWEFSCYCEGCQIEMDEECWLDSMAGATDWANTGWVIDYE